MRGIFKRTGVVSYADGSSEVFVDDFVEAPIHLPDTEVGPQLPEWFGEAYAWFNRQHGRELLLVDGWLWQDTGSPIMANGVPVAPFVWTRIDA